MTKPYESSVTASYAHQIAACLQCYPLSADRLEQVENILARFRQDILESRAEFMRSSEFMSDMENFVRDLMITAVLHAD